MTISRRSLCQLGLAASVATVSPTVAEEQATPRQDSSRKTLIRNVDVLTMEDNHSELTGMDVLLAQGRIAAIATAIPAADAEVVDGTGRILMPGLIDGFRNNWQSLDTGRLLKMNQSAKEYYPYLAKLTQAMTAEDRFLSDYWGGLEALNSGYTAMINLGRYDPSEGTEAACAGFKASGIRGVFCHSMTAAFPAPLPGDAEFKIAEKLRDKHFQAGNDVEFGLIMNLHWAASYEQFRSYFERARQLNPKVLFMYHHSYGGGFGGQPLFTPPVLPPRTVRTVADLRDCGVLGPDLQIGHGTELTDGELKILADAGCTFSSAVLSEYTYPQGQTSIHARAQAAGAPASLAFDTTFGQSRDPFEMIRAAFVSLYKTPESRKLADTLGSDDALVWLTRDAAKCARVADQAGTITVGKRADVVLVNTDRIGFPAIGTLADRVASFGLLSDIDSVWVAGTPRKRNGKMVGVDMRALKAKVIAHQYRVWEAMGSPEYGIRG